VRIDLHTHTTASDGTDTPAELVVAARRAGLDVLAVTDHDTTAGWADAIAARPSGLTLVTGVEFSCVHHAADGRRISMHLLGYLFDPDHPALRAELERLRAGRLHRGRLMVENLVAGGYPITWEQVQAFADGGSVGRPHIGRALIQAGAVTDLTAAFRGPLSGRGTYYVRKPDTPVFDALRIIDQAGGTSVFAHPLAHRRGPVVDDSVIVELAAAGLRGIEVDHPDHDEADRAHAATLARELDLIPTGSSDYHGTNKTVRLGENLTTPDAYERLVAVATARRPIAG
jgi:predicted metal-dependent phosphoesterase TrpH